MPFHQAITTGLSSEVIMSGDIQQAALGQVTLPAGLRRQCCHQYTGIAYRILQPDLKCCSLTAITR